MKQKVHPVVAVLLVLIIAGVIFGVMWWQSEAPIVGVLPKGSGLGPRPPASAQSAGPSKESGEGRANKNAKGGFSTGEAHPKPGTEEGAR